MDIVHYLVYIFNYHLENLKNLSCKITVTSHKIKDNEDVILGFFNQYQFTLICLRKQRSIETSGKRVRLNSKYINTNYTNINM